ncbi:hypothetical protein ABZP36_008790 [Zizania latifolia]
MPPKRKSPAAAGASPRKTRSMAAGKQRGEAPAKVAKKEAAAPEQKGKKRAKREDGEAAAVVEKKNAGAVASDGKRVIVEACTQCRQFKIRAMKVKEDLESAVPGVSAIINPEKPRRGCLEIREEGGEVFISLLNMPRPFTAMKKLDMDDVIKDIANKIS